MRSPRLSLTRSQLALGIRICDLALGSFAASVVELEQAYKEATTEYLTIHERLGHYGRAYHPVAQKRALARAALFDAQSSIAQTRALRGKLQATLEKET